jgi:hypothetical protein
VEVGGPSVDELTARGQAVCAWRVKVVCRLSDPLSSFTLMIATPPSGGVRQDGQHFVCSAIVSSPLRSGKSLQKTAGSSGNNIPAWPGLSHCLISGKFLF